VFRDINLLNFSTDQIFNDFEIEILRTDKFFLSNRIIGYYNKRVTLLYNVGTTSVYKNCRVAVKL